MQNGPEHRSYDVVIVGARVAGAATAMLLARQGLRVLAVDGERLGSDTLSTHALMRGAVRRLADWGLLDAVWEADTPVIERVAFSYGGHPFVVDVRPEPGLPGLAAPRRTVLDPILVDGARAAGAEVLHETRVVHVQSDRTGRVSGVRLAGRDGTEVTVTADLVVGADGLRSSVARAVAAPVTARGQSAAACTIRYYTDLDVDRSAFGWVYAPGVGGGLIPTNAGAVCVFTGMPPEELQVQRRGDLERAHHRNLRRLAPELADAVRAATPVGPVRSFPGVRGQFRRPFGPGWALVGDAGYFKDPAAAHGIADALRDAELLTRAVLTGDFAGYESDRDTLSRPVFEVLERIASFEWDLETLAGLHERLSKAMRAEEQAVLAAPAGPVRRTGPARLPKRLLGIWAHPDDEAYLSAGVMARVIDAGGAVTVVTATRGEQGTADPTRVGTEGFASLRGAELAASLEVLGVTDLRFLGLADGACADADDHVMIGRLRDLIDQVDPDAIVTFGPDGITGHPDHRAVSRWVTEAWKRSDRRAELLYAAMTEEFLRRHADLHGQLGLLEGYGVAPDGIPTSAVVLACHLTPTELVRKRRALAGHASQTVDLAAVVGERRYARWWRNETFRRPTAAELGARTTVTAARR
jgi:flavin-dependent dehydrogenase/LmbE family N-acetylglucosaminyl deacetylase